MEVERISIDWGFGKRETRSLSHVLRFGCGAVRSVRSQDTAANRYLVVRSIRDARVDLELCQVWLFGFPSPHLKSGSRYTDTLESLLNLTQPDLHVRAVLTHSQPITVCVHNSQLQVSRTLSITTVPDHPPWVHRLPNRGWRRAQPRAEFGKRWMP